MVQISPEEVIRRRQIEQRSVDELDDLDRSIGVSPAGNLRVACLSTHRSTIAMTARQTPLAPATVNPITQFRVRRIVGISSSTTRRRVS